jgi:hypothetical protein
MIDTKGLRCLIGFLGMALPWTVLGLALSFDCGVPESISATYFMAPCITPFMITLGASGILLIMYRGYDIVDNILNTAAGIFGLGVCLFPCDGGNEAFIGTFQVAAGVSNIIHMITAIGFFGILAYNSLFQFTKGNPIPTENKKKRNIIYRVCGIGMIASFLCLPLASLGIPSITWLVETIALTFFGISWLTKADCIPFLFADKKD